jgi:hypothetical protein
MPAKRKKKARKMDQKLLSSEKHEIAYMAKKLKVSRKLIRLARLEAGRSRVQVTAFVLGWQAAFIPETGMAL